MLNQAEDRQFQRMDLPCEIIYKLPDSNQSHTGECLNISGSGILFRGKHLLECGMALELTVATKNAFTTPLRAYVEVIRSKSVDQLAQYEIATEIKGIREY